MSEKVEKQEAPAEKPAKPEESIEGLYKVIADLQEIVRELALSVGAAEEARRGLNETLAGVVKRIENLEKAVSERTVGGAPEPETTNAPAKVTPKIETETEQVAEPSEKARKEVLKKVVAPRPEVELTEAKKEEGESVITKILKGEVKAGDIPALLTGKKEVR